MLRALRLALAVLQLCAAAIVGWAGVMAGFASFVLLALILVYLAFETAGKALT